MRMKYAAVLAATLFTAAACEIPLAPKWNIDVFFPLKYPDVQLSQYAGPGGVIPTTPTAFTTPADSDDVADATAQVLDQDIASIKADLIFINQTNVLGNLRISLAPNRLALNSTNPAQAVTVTIPLHITPATGDTIHVNVNPDLFANANKIYTQSSGDMRSGTGGLLIVGPTDRFRISVDLTANVPFSKEGGSQ